MAKTVTAPDLTPGYPSKGPRLGPAWADIWRALARVPDDFQDGYPIATRVAEKHGLSPSTLIGLIKRAATAGLLDREPKMVNTGKRGNRARTHYRIARGADE
jgi:hypothetical protein